MSQNTVDASFSNQLLGALQTLHSPAVLGEQSPLAAPYFLGTYLSPSAGEASARPAARGMALRRLFEEALETLGRQSEEGAYHRRVIEASFFERTRLDGVWDELGRSRPQYYRDRKQALAAFEEVLVRLLNPALRLERPVADAPLIGRELDVERCRQLLAPGRSVSIVGPSGIGKTSLAASVATSLSPRPLFWHTFHLGINDNVASLLFALAHFLHLQGAPDLWLQLVADNGKINPQAALGMLRYDLERMASREPILCFDEVDLLQPESDAHAQILSLLESLPKTATVVCIGQHLEILADDVIALDQLSLASIRDFLQARDIRFRTDMLERLEAFTRGNPRLLNLYAALHGAGENVEEVLADLSAAPSMGALLNRVWRRLDDAQRRILAFLAVFRRPAPADHWQSFEEQYALRKLVELHLAQNAGMGAVNILPAYGQVLYQELSPEVREQLHADGAAVRAARGQYTSALYHLVRAGMPEAAVRLWYRVRQMEIDQGQASTALQRFDEISQNQLREQDDREMLGLIRSELLLLRGEYAAARETIRSTHWTTPIFKARAARIDGDVLELQGDFGAAFASYQKGLAGVEETLEHELILFHRDLGWIGRRQRSYADALAQAQSGACEIEMLWGHIKKDTGDLAEARAHYERALTLAQQMNNRHNEARADNALAFVLAKQGKFDDAERHFDRAYTTFKQIGKYFSMASVRVNQAVDRLLRGEPEAVQPLAAESLMVFERLAHPYGVATAHQVLAESYLALGELERAERHAQDAMGTEESGIVPDALRVLGEVEHRRRNLTEAVALLRQAVELAQENKDRYLEAYAWRSLGQAHADAGSRALAVEALKRAMELFSEMELDREIDRCHQVASELGIEASEEQL